MAGLGNDAMRNISNVPFDNVWVAMLQSQVYTRIHKLALVRYASLVFDYLGSLLFLVGLLQNCSILFPAIADPFCYSPVIAKGCANDNTG